MIAMDNQRKERDRLRLEISKDKGLSAVTIGLNSSTGGVHAGSAYPSNSAMIEGMSQVAASSQQMSPRREMTSGAYERNQRISDFSANIPGHVAAHQSPARPHQAATRKRKWWKKLFRWCGRTDGDTY
jgi:hypothetical protein